MAIAAQDLSFGCDDHQRRERAEIAARRLVARGATALASRGVAGGLDPGLRPGTVILPDTVIGSEGCGSGVDLEWRNRLQERIDALVVTSTSSLYDAGARPDLALS